jgi:hypothetical protein
VREVDGWVYSSHAESVTDDGAGLDIRRRRQAVSPDGDLSEEEFTERLEDLDAERLEAEAEEAGLRPAGRVAVPSTEGYLGSTLVILEAA